ncbi:MAG: hypothetical protein LBE12_04980 [Planctomycetaceae bacterium]|nr:hypothetical protein [Planctomycetaceae bacterium]
MSVISFSCESVNPNFLPIPEVEADSFDTPIFHEILKPTNSVVSTAEIAQIFEKHRCHFSGRYWNALNVFFTFFTQILSGGLVIVQKYLHIFWVILFFCGYFLRS